AAINANLSGGGLEMAMACDFRFMAKNASASQSEVNVGILPGSGGTQRMPRLVGMAKAMELMLTGRRVFAEEAERIGLITRAIEPMQLMPEVMNFARAMTERPPLAIAHTKKCIYAAMDMPIREGLDMERRLFQELVKSPEAMGRMKAYVSTGQPSPRQRIQLELEAIHKKWVEECQNT
ncbi:MAG: enoyl-CoA hydratase/isomerase family protein, partial [Dehalococcoidales bacterium]|nr:enoyl-CoA hydratase/isomerase family protein [Dehalococcoidales bacterium]